MGITGNSSAHLIIYLSKRWLTGAFDLFYVFEIFYTDNMTSCITMVASNFKIPVTSQECDIKLARFPVT